MKKNILLFCLALPLLLPASLKAMQFALPVDCALGTECFIQNYVDTDPSEGWKDFMCGNLSYDGHDGTDFRVRDFVAMERGVSVLAAADGVVKGFRDGVPDTGVEDPQAIQNKECGNGVLIAHEDGWETQYCHMKKGSVRAQKGQVVKAGDIIGKIGYSGKAAFPHLHLTIRKNGKALDPFTAAAFGSTTCSKSAQGSSLWQNPQQINYQPTALLNASFTTEIPTAEAVRKGKFYASRMLPDAPVLLIWADIMGVQAGDKIVLQFNAPDGTRLFTKEEVIANPKVLQFMYAGRKRPEGILWTAGVYSGSVRLVRGAQTVFDQPLRIEATAKE